MTQAVRKQCKACPWRKDVVPDRDIPNGYCATKHAALKSTIAEPGSLFAGKLRIMACHESAIGRELVCIGWLDNQLGPGNNLALRWLYSSGRFGRFETVGEQHDCLEDTLPKKRRKRVKS